MKKHEKTFHQDYHLPGQGKKQKQYKDSATFFLVAFIGLIIIISIAIFFNY